MDDVRNGKRVLGKLCLDVLYEGKLFNPDKDAGELLIEKEQDICKNLPRKGYITVKAKAIINSK